MSEIKNIEFNNEKSLGEAISICINTINELISTVNDQQKKIDFIMESEVLIGHNFPDDIFTKSLKELWEEKHINDSTLYWVNFLNKKAIESCKDSCVEFELPKPKEDWEDFCNKRWVRIRKQIAELKKNNKNIEDYYINDKDEVVLGRPDVIYGRLYGLNIGHISKTKAELDEQIAKEAVEKFKEELRGKITGILTRYVDRGSDFKTSSQKTLEDILDLLK